MDQEILKENSSLKQSNQFLLSRVEELEELVRHLQRKRFAPKSESLLHPGMRSLFDEEPEPEKPAEEVKETEIKAHKRKTSKKTLPADLPREEIHCDLTGEEKSCPCCKEPMVRTHEKISEKLHLKPAECLVRKYIMPVYGCKACETVKQAKMPAHPIPKCTVTPETIAHIAVTKYIDGMPLHRLEKIFQRHKIEVNRDQMARWMISIGEKLRPMKDLLHKKLLESGSFGMDETHLQVLKEKGRRPDQKSFMLVQAREGPPGQSITLFHYEKSRSAETIGRYLRGFTGSLNTDGLAVYASYCRDTAISHGGCWSHARRPFADAVKGKKKNVSTAKTALQLIKKLFEIEKDIKGAEPEIIAAARAERSRPVIEEIKSLWIEKIDTVPPKSLTGKALNYLKNQWDLLVAFLDDPRLQLHNNFVEQQIRPMAVGRKAWLFCDSVGGAEASAVLFSLLNTAKVNGINPYEWLCNVLVQISQSDDIESLLPMK